MHVSMLVLKKLGFDVLGPCFRASLCNAQRVSRTILASSSYNCFLLELGPSNVALHGQFWLRAQKKVRDEMQFGEPPLHICFFEE